MSQRLNSDAEQIMEWILLLKIKLDRIYRIVRIFSLSLSCHCLNMQLIKNIGIAEIMLWPNYPPAGGCCFHGFIW